jgi:hypothetical protein
MPPITGSSLRAGATHDGATFAAGSGFVSDLPIKRT